MRKNKEHCVVIKIARDSPPGLNVKESRGTGGIFQLLKDHLAVKPVKSGKILLKEKNLFCHV
jgi:hypothetical protein